MKVIFLLRPKTNAFILLLKKCERHSFSIFSRKTSEKINMKGKKSQSFLLTGIKTKDPCAVKVSTPVINLKKHLTF